jgi:hypothetical protein
MITRSGVFSTEFTLIVSRPSCSPRWRAYRTTRPQTCSGARSAPSAHASPVHAPTSSSPFAPPKPRSSSSELGGTQHPEHPAVVVGVRCTRLGSSSRSPHTKQELLASAGPLEVELCRSEPAEQVRTDKVPVRGRRRWESNPCTGLCRPLPEPLGHVAITVRRPGTRAARYRRISEVACPEGARRRCRRTHHQRGSPARR